MTQSQRRGSLDNSLGAVVRARIFLSGEENSSPDFCQYFLCRFASIRHPDCTQSISLLLNNKALICSTNFLKFGFSGDFCPKLIVLFLCGCYNFFQCFFYSFICVDSSVVYLVFAIENNTKIVK